MEAGEEQEALRLVREALEQDPECIEALILQAQSQGQPEDRLEGLRKAVEIGARGIAQLDAPPGLIGLDPAARPYLQALYSLARGLLTAGRVVDALRELEELLVVDARDGLGVRYELTALYLTADRLADAQRIESRYPDDQGAFLSWARTLIYYRLGDYTTARTHLQTAREANPFVEEALADPEARPERMEALHAMGDESEAQWILFHQGIAWMFNPLAVEWLEGELDPDHPDYTGPLDGCFAAFDQ